MMNDRTSRLEVVIPPASEPVTLSEAKSFLRIEHTGEDGSIALAIAAAREAAEQYLRVVLLPQTLDYNVGCLEHSLLPLPMGPARSIVSVTFYDANHVPTLVHSSNYSLSQDGYALHFSNLPCASYAVLRYEAGLVPNPAALSSLIKQGILHHVSAMVEARDGNIPMPIASLQAYQPFRRMGL